jgi:hypothetical protein
LARRCAVRSAVAVADGLRQLNSTPDRLSTVIGTIDRSAKDAV